MPFLRPAKSVAHTTPDPEMTRLSRLFANALSAEYALNIGIPGSPADAGDTDWKMVIDWVFPQAYYSPAHMVSAYLFLRNGLTEDAYYMSEDGRHQQVDNLLDAGEYPAEWRRSNGENFLKTLDLMRPRTDNALRFKLENIEELYAGTLKIVGEINGWHERAICRMIGTLRFRQLIENMPGYLLDGPIGTRLASLTEREKEVANG